MAVWGFGEADGRREPHADGNGQRFRNESRDAEACVFGEVADERGDFGEHGKAIETSGRVEFHAIPPWVHVSMVVKRRNRLLPTCKSRVEIA